MQLWQFLYAILEDRFEIIEWTANKSENSKMCVPFLLQSRAVVFSTTKPKLTKMPNKS